MLLVSMGRITMVCLPSSKSRVVQHGQQHMNPIYFFIGGLVLSIAWFKMELLILRKSLLVVLGLSASLFLIGLVLLVIGSRSYLAGVLLCPLLSLGLFRLFRRVFLRCYDREPRDTLLNWSSGLAGDRLFNVLYFILGGLILLFVPVIIRRLGEAGW